MDRLPRDIAQERMHHGIVRLLDEYSLVRSPRCMAPRWVAATLSPPLCSPGGYLGSLQAPHAGRARRPASPAPRAWPAAARRPKDLKARRKKSKMARAACWTAGSVLSPWTPSSPRLPVRRGLPRPPALPFPAVSLRAPQPPAAVPEAHLGVSHLSVAAKPEWRR